METLLVLAEKYGLAVFICGLIGSILVGCIKTPMRHAVNKKIEAFESTDPRVTRTATIMDIVTYFISMVVAVLVTVAYLLIFKQFTWRSLLSVTIAVWPVQTAVYNVWKKLGLKKLLLIIWEEFKKAIVRSIDKDKNGKIELNEVMETAKDLTEGGKLNTDKLVDMAKDATPSLVEGVLTSVDKEASKVEMPPEPEQTIGERIADMILEKAKTEAAEKTTIEINEADIESVEGVNEVPEDATVYDEAVIVEASEAPKETPVTPSKVGKISIIKL